MQYVAFEKGIEVNGQTVYSIVDGFQVIKRIPNEILAAEGVGSRDGDGNLQLDPQGWYSQAAWLRAFERIAREVGVNLLFQIGQRIPQNAQFPPWVQDIDSALKSVDIAYHMNHRKAGQVMFDPEAGTMLDGIGHYGYQRVAGKNHIVCVCENPYPCQFDRGIITAMAKRFEPAAVVLHDADAPCRQKRGNSCTYQVTW